MQTYYAHLNEIYVSKGQYIGTEEVLGTFGTTGYSTGPHLHFELRVGGILWIQLNIYYEFSFSIIVN